MSNYPPTPELDKMLAVKDKSQMIGVFLDWLQDEKKIVFAKYYDEESLCPSYDTIEKLLADYFEIDLNKIEQERRAILESFQNA